jgi:hypothetical protein
MIGEMLGESRRLHRLAERQHAVYQRQAAQRMGHARRFWWAMLCDGVGLGKTYATTLMVHYANTEATSIPG